VEGDIGSELHARKDHGVHQHSSRLDAAPNRQSKARQHDIRPVSNPQGDERPRDQ
jgi:hypothetical protein